MQGFPLAECDIKTFNFFLPCGDDFTGRPGPFGSLAQNRCVYKKLKTFSIGP